MAVTEGFAQSGIEHDMRRAHTADALLQLVVQGVVSRDDTANALAALGLTWPDLDAAMTRRRKHGWAGPRPAPVAAVRTLPIETVPERDARLARQSRERPSVQAANPAPGVKRCARCREHFPIESFRLKSASSGSPQRWSYCEPCRKEKQRERYLSVKKARMLNEVGLSFIVSESDDVDGLVCLVCLQPIKPGEQVHGRASLTHEVCPT